jgi:glycosyltransferase involved in cell wall biosynthesis
LLTGRSLFRQVYRKRMQHELDGSIAKHEIELVHCCTQMLGFFRFPDHVRVVSDTHEVTYDLLHRMARATRHPIKKAFTWLQYRLGKQEELRVCRTFDTLLSTTPRDHEVFEQERANEHIVTIGNGVEEMFYETLNVDPEPNTLVFTGKMSFFPNKTGIIRFLDEIFPLILEQIPAARIYVVGAEPAKELLRRNAENVVVTGFVDDVRPYIAKSGVFVIPLWVTSRKGA